MQQSNIMASKLISPSALKMDKYYTWKKEMQVWELITSLNKSHPVSTVFLFLKGKARESILELDITILNANDEVQNLLEKIGHIF